jgi:hypothetical protein
MILDAVVLVARTSTTEIGSTAPVGTPTKWT